MVKKPYIPLPDEQNDRNRGRHKNCGAVMKRKSSIFIVYYNSMIDFIDISYLAHGNDKQQLVYYILCEHQILNKLNVYKPIVVGTIPIEIDIPNSDVDIICEVSDFNQFHVLVKKEFSEFEGFDFQIQESHYVANFSIDGLPIEIYAENKPTQYQNAYLHMMIEYRLIQLLGADFKASIVTLKQQGYKTEPAFGKLLGLKNPYMDLLELERKTNDELFEMEVSRKQKP